MMSKNTKQVLDLCTDKQLCASIFG